MKFHRNPSITSSDMSITSSDNPLKCKNPVCTNQSGPNPVPGSRLWSGSGSKVNQRPCPDIIPLTSNISSKSIHAFFSNLADRQTDRQTDKREQTHLPPPLSDVITTTSGFTVTSFFGKLIQFQLAKLDLKHVR